MKKIFFAFAILALAASCAKEAAAPDNGGKNGNKELVEMSFTVSSELVKAGLNSDRSVSFKKADSISIFANGTNYKFTATEAGAAVTFTGSAEEASVYYALYPYTSGATIDGSTIKGASIQSGSQGTGTGGFNSKQVVLVASTTGTHLLFRQVCALLKITVPADVTDLKEIIGFNRDNGSSNLAGAISGTFDIALGDNDDPTVTVTTPKFQIGIVGPSGSDNPMPAGDYYIPVLPAQLTIKKGIDLKLTFMDDFVGRAFNGKGIKLKAGQVYDLGTVKRTDTYVDSGFESGDASLEYFYSDNTAGDGNSSSLSVINNPHPTASNPSAHVLSDNMAPKTNNTSGYFEVRSGADAGYVKFPSGVRQFYDKIRFKVWLGTNAYYPRIKRGSESAAMASKINGVAITGDNDTAKKAVWDANVKTDDWNILEYTVKSLTSSWSNFSSLATWQIRPFVNFDGTNTSGYDETTNNRIVYIDDITYVLK